jgi:hypothetical protein
MALERPGAELATSPDDTVLFFGNNGTKAVAKSSDEIAYQTLARLSVRDLVALDFDAMEVWTRGQGPAATSPLWTPFKSFLGG